MAGKTKVFRISFRVSLAAAFFLAALPPIFAQPDELTRAKELYSEGTELIELQTKTALEAAKEKYLQANTIFSRSGEKEGEAKSLVGLGFVSNALGENPEALQFYESALALFTELRNDYWAARTLNNMGRVYDDTGNTEKALELFNLALPKRRAAADANGEAVTLNSIGAVYVKKGEFQKGLQHYKSAYAIRNSLSIPDDNANRRGTAIILNNIGRVFDELGDKKKAFEYLNRSLVLRRSTNDRNGEATTLNNLGLVSFDMGNLQEALDYYQKALEIIDELGQEFREAEILNNTAVVHIENKEADPALRYLNKAIVYYRLVGDRGGEATTLNNIGMAEQLKGVESSSQRLAEALLLSRQAGEASLEAITLNNLMLNWRARGNASIASFYGKQAVNKYQEMRFGIRTLGEDTRRNYIATIKDTYRALADILIELGQFAQANQVLNMLKAEEYFDFVRRSSDEIKKLDTRVALTKKEQELLERYRKIADRVTQLSREFQELDNEERQARRAGEKLDDESLNRQNALSSQLSDANAAFRLFVQKQLVAELGKERVREIEYDRSLQTKLRRWGDGTVAIYTLLTEERYRVVMTTPFVQVDGKSEIKSADLNKKIYEFRQALQDLSVDPRVKGKELYDLLLKPIEKELKAADAKTLVWSLDGTLRYIPVGALSKDGKNYLVEDYKNAVITIQTRDDLADENPDWIALGLGVSKASRISNPGNPEEVIDFGSIPGSVAELESIISDERKPGEAGVLKGRRLVDEEFTVSAFEEALATENADGKPKFSVVHLASHFRLGNNWSDSFLLLGNGKVLTLEQISNSPTLNFGDVELITLSACDTAFANSSNGKEIDSLAEAIQSKSGKAVLATLWAVADESTPLLMTEFYRLRKENPKLTKAEAIRDVQRGFVSGRLKPDAEYIERLATAFPERGEGDPPGKFVFDKKKPFAHPYFWSPFVLIGNWR